MKESSKMHLVWALEHCQDLFPKYQGTEKDASSVPTTNVGWLNAEWIIIKSIQVLSPPKMSDFLFLIT